MVFFDEFFDEFFEKLFDELFDEFFDDFFDDFFFLLTIASFRIGVPSILFLSVREESPICNRPLKIVSAAFTT